MRRSGTVNYVTHMQNLRETFDRYLQAAGISDMDMLVDAIVKEQLLQSLPPNVHVFVASREPKNSNETAIATDISFHVSKAEKETKFGVDLESHGNSLGTCGQALHFTAQRPAALLLGRAEGMEDTRTLLTCTGLQREVKDAIQWRRTTQVSARLAR